MASSSFAKFSEDDVKSFSDEQENVNTKKIEGWMMYTRIIVMLAVGLPSR